MKMWNVSFSYTAVVVAENELEAHRIARQHTMDVVEDAGYSDMEVTVEKEIKSPADFENGWDAECIPYGGPTDARIGELNPALNSGGGDE
ncbi:MAG: hypothetical protein [Caudoviricetes sp.]|nr:MAG: hypothetical protein [Caudoviricetes sp.]